jgi:aldose sugar dehydrogenase
MLRQNPWIGLSAAVLALGIAAAPARAEITDAAKPSQPSKVKVETFAAGLEHPWGMQFLPDGRLLVTERPGSMRIIGKDGTLSEPVAGVPKVAARNQGGLLDVLLAPDFADTGTIYFSYGEPRGGGKNGTSVARATLKLDDGGGTLEDVKVIFQQTPAADSGHHFGSRLVWAGDGTLFVTTGDRNVAKQEAQNPANHIGKVIRINTDGGAAAANPKGDGWAPEVWSYGHRNIQGAAIRPETGKLYTVEHGARGGDELNQPEKGKNYGWPVISYGIDYSGAPIGEGISEKEGMEPAVYYWVPSIATSGLAFYEGDLFPDWKGNAFVGGLAQEQVARLVFEGDEVVAEETLFEDQGKRIRDVRSGPDGALWLLTDDTGEVLRVTPAD